MNAPAVAIVIAGLLYPTATIPVRQDTQTVGTFTVSKRLDPIDDANRSMAITHSKVGNATFGWRCMSDGLNVVYGPGKYMGGDSDDEVLVILRLDSDPPLEKQYWEQATNKQAAFMPMRHVTSFTARAKQTSKLVARMIDPLDGETVTNEFQFVGLENALSLIGPCQQ